MKATALLVSTLFAGSLVGAWAAGPNDLGKSLTSMGADKEANKDGSIPAWSGTQAPQPGWAYGKLRADYWQHKDEKPLFTINAGNVDKYASRLSPGQLALFKQVKDYRMDVYPSHRTCSAPDFVAENTRKNVDFAKLGADGWSLKEAAMPGIPFPLPKNGVEAMWNAKMRYRGVGVDWKNNVTSVGPRKGGSEWIEAGQEATLFYPWGGKGSVNLSQLPPVEYYIYFAYNSPAALAGQALSVKFFLDQPGSETFLYFPGQRRVRRMPTYAYDAPQIGMENQYTLDEPSVFNGTLDRFDWKLAGKKEMYVAYNSFGAYDFTSKLKDVAKADFLDPARRRYELHRVWVVEATVKSGARHTAPKRTFYLDEDSWALMAADDYDAQGAIYKTREAYLIPVYETGSCDQPGFTQFNLAEGRYMFDQTAIGAGKDLQWVTEPTGVRYKANFYTFENLRAISER